MRLRNLLANPEVALLTLGAAALMLARVVGCVSGAASPTEAPEEAHAAAQVRAEVLSHPPREEAAENQAKPADASVQKSGAHQATVKQAPAPQTPAKPAQQGKQAPPQKATDQAPVKQPPKTQPRPTPAPPRPPAQIAWQQSHNDALAKARELGKPFWAHISRREGCAPCRRFEQRVLSDPEFVAFVNEHFVAFRCYAEDYPEWCRANGVRSVPTDFVHVEHAQPLHRYRTTLPPDPEAAAEQLRRMIQKSVLVPDNPKHRAI